jgi:hypothetical protein
VRRRTTAAHESRHRPSPQAADLHRSEGADRRFRAVRDAKGYTDNRAQKLSSVRMKLLTINDYFQADPG